MKRTVEIYNIMDNDCSGYRVIFHDVVGFKTRSNNQFRVTTVETNPKFNTDFFFFLIDHNLNSNDKYSFKQMYFYTYLRIYLIRLFLYILFTLS